MKTVFTIGITAVVTWIAVSLFHGMHTGAERLWMVSAIKAPGMMAISDIQEDMNAGRYDIAKAKVDTFMTTWQRFEAGPDSCRGAGIGDIMVAFSKIPGRTNVEPGGAASGSQPSRSNTNQPPPAAGFRR